MWARGQLPDMPTSQLVTGTTLVAVLTSIPEILFAYFMMYYALDRFLKRYGQPWVNVTWILAVFLACTVLSRLATFNVLKYVYDGRLAQTELFNALVVSRALVFMGFASGMSVSLKLLRHQLAAKQREKDLLKEKLSSELKLLRSQLHPHFLFNTLNNIYALSRMKSDLAPEAILKLSDLLSFMLYESKEDRIPIEHEILFLEDYIALEKIRYDGRVSIAFKKSVSNPSDPIASLILLPLVENAFKHGAGETRFDSFIDIQLTQASNNFNFNIQNSYDRNSVDPDREPIGLNNIRRQLELLYQDYHLDVTDDGKVFSVKLHLNLDTYGKN